MCFRAVLQSRTALNNLLAAGRVSNETAQTDSHVYHHTPQGVPGAAAAGPGRGDNKAQSPSTLLPEHPTNPTHPCSTHLSVSSSTGRPPERWGTAPGFSRIKDRERHSLRTSHPLGGPVNVLCVLADQAQDLLASTPGVSSETRNTHTNLSSKSIMDFSAFTSVSQHAQCNCVFVQEDVLSLSSLSNAFLWLFDKPILASEL